MRVLVCMYVCVCMRIHNSTNENIIIIKLEEKTKRTKDVCNGLGKKKLESGNYCFNVWEQ